ncbi:hypothetical protein BaRGS_00035515, partial [Batillaria attramentaria]
MAARSFISSALGVKKLKDDIRKLAHNVRGPEPPKILFMGETGSGKSSLISSIVSALKGSIIYTSTVGEKEGHEVNTSKRAASEIWLFLVITVDWNCQLFWIMPCLHEYSGKVRRQQGAADEEIVRLIDGKLRHGDLIEDEKGSYDGSRISDRESKPPCCVVFVQKAQRLGDVDKDVQEKLHEASLLVRNRGIPSSVVLTHIDQVKPSLEGSLHIALRSDKIQDRVSAAAGDMGCEREPGVCDNTHTRRVPSAPGDLPLRATNPSESGYGTQTSSMRLSSASPTEISSVPTTSYSDRSSKQRQSYPRASRRSNARHTRESSDPVTTQQSPEQKRLSQTSLSSQRDISFDHHIGDSPPDLQNENKSDSDQYSFHDGDDLLQEAIYSLSTHPFPDFYNERAELRGAKPLFRPILYQRRDTSVTTSDESELSHQLKKDHHVEENVCRIVNDLQTWSDNNPGSLWVSDTLPVDFGLPIERYPPDSIDSQVLFLAPDLPPFVLTIYDPERILQHEDITDERDARKLIDEEKADVEDFTLQTSKLLTTALFNYCHCDFLLLPVALEYKELCPDALEKEIRKQQDSTRRYYDGPRRLNSRTYAELKAAAIAVNGVSHVPSLLRMRPEEMGAAQRPGQPQEFVDQEVLYILDPDWRGTVSLLIERVIHNHSCHVTYPESGRDKLVVAVMEAAKRISFVEEVIILSTDRALQECC